MAIPPEFGETRLMMGTPKVTTLYTSVTYFMNYFEKATSFESLYEALPKVCRNVRWKPSVIKYETHGLSNTLKLYNEIQNGTYKISKYQVFRIYEPKEREIQATRIRDRQLQRSLCDNGLYQDITQHFIIDNPACQKYKGTDFTFNRIKDHLRRYYRKYGCDGWYLKCDIRKFFPSTRHDIAKAICRKRISDDKAYEYVCMVIDSFGGDKGIGLGSQISQLVELCVSNELSHFMKEVLHLRHFVQYMDDIIIFHNDKEYLKYCLVAINGFLKSHLALELNTKTTIQPIRHGFEFMQWKFRITNTGKVLMLMPSRKVYKQRKKIDKMLAMESEGKIPKGTTANSLECWLANVKRGNTVKIQKDMVAYFKEKEKQYDKTTNTRSII